MASLSCLPRGALYDIEPLDWADSANDADPESLRAMMSCVWGGGRVRDVLVTEFVIN